MSLLPDRDAQILLLTSRIRNSLFHFWEAFNPPFLVALHTLRFPPQDQKLLLGMCVGGRLLAALLLGVCLLSCILTAINLARLTQVVVYTGENMRLSGSHLWSQFTGKAHSWSQPHVFSHNASTDYDPRFLSQPHEAQMYKEAPVKAAIVVLAPRHDASMPYWGHDGIVLKRRWVLLNALQSVDASVNSRFNYKYPVFIFHEDWNTTDMGWLRSEVHTFVNFVRVDLHQPPCYTNMQQIDAWSRGEDGAIPGRPMGYRMMCRAWSGVIQRHEALRGLDMYMRIDDDSAIWQVPDWDIFVHVRSRNLLYAYHSSATDSWGITQMWEMHQEFVKDPQAAVAFVNKHACNAAYELDMKQLLTNLQDMNISADTTHSRMRATGYLQGNNYNGAQPYNNFHISDLSLWRTELIRVWFDYLDLNLGFMKYRFGDANVHALLIGSLLPGNRVGVVHDPKFRYQHNINTAPRRDWVNASIVQLPEARGDPERVV